MDSTLATVEQGFAAGMQHIENLRNAVSRHYKALECSRRALHANLCALASAEERASTCVMDLSPLPRSPSLPLVVELTETDSHAALQPAGEVVNEAARESASTGRGSSPDGMKTVGPLFLTREASHLPADTTRSYSSWRLPLSLHLMATAYDSPASQRNTLELHTQTIQAQVLQHQQQGFLHAAKLQFAEEWARLALPWFDEVVHRQFYGPLLRRLTRLDERLQRLCTRMSLDLPQYTPLIAHKGGDAESSNEGFAGAAMSCASKLWSHYLHTALQKLHQALPPGTLIGECTAAAAPPLPPPFSLITVNETCSTSESGQTTAVATGPSMTVAEDEEVVIVAPLTAEGAGSLQAALLHTPRSLRHVWHVLRCGLTESYAHASINSPQQPFSPSSKEERGCGGERSSITSPLRDGGVIKRLGSCECCQGGSDQGTCLDCSVADLLRRRATLCPRSTYPQGHLGEANSLVYPQEDVYAWGGGDFIVEALVALLTFARRVCLLRKVLRCGHDECDSRQSLNSLLFREENNNNDVAAVRRHASDRSVYLRSQRLASLSAGEPHPPLEELVLLPFHLLHQILFYACGAQSGVALRQIDHGMQRREQRGICGAETLGGPRQLHHPTSCAASLSPSVSLHGGASEGFLDLRTARDDILSLVRWWQSPCSCDCRCAYARLVRLTKLYYTPSKETLSTAVQERCGRGACRTTPAVSTDARLCQLRNAELQIREQWQELQTRLLVAHATSLSSSC